MPFTPGQILHDRYRIDGLLGQGGMGAVYDALDLRLGIRCAVKENLLFTEAAQRQFEREARLLATLRHPHLPRVSDHFVIPGQGQYLVMDFVEGEDLKHRLQQQGPLPEADVIRWSLEILDALAYLHSRNIIHRDIKPANIKVTPTGSAILVDFGIAKQIDVGGGLTTTGAQGLTPGFAPPEQYGMGRTDAYSDVYAFGATLYVLLTNEVPADALSRMTRPEKYIPLSRRATLSNPALAALVDQALALEPADRYVNAGEMLTALGNLKTRAQSPKPLEAQASEQQPTLLSDQTMLRPGSFQAPSTSQPRAETSAGAASLPSAVVSNSGRRLLPWLIGGLLSLFVIIGLVGSAMLGLPMMLAVLATATQTATATAPPTSTPTRSPTATIAPTATLTPAPTPIGGGGGLIAFSNNRDIGGNLREVYVMRVDGSNETRLTDNPSDNAYPRWSPDGQRLLFYSFREGNAEVYVMNVDGKQVRNLTQNPGQDFDAVWSPDGTQIVFTSLRDNNREIYVMNADGSGQTNLTNNGAEDAYAAWSPDSTRIVFQSNRDGNEELYLMNRDGSDLTRLTNAASYDGFPHWSSDNQYIAFASDRDGNLELYRMRADGTEFFRLTNNPARDFFPTWSPDGSELAFMSDRDGNLEIYLLNVAAVLSGGEGLTRLSNNAADDYNPAWQP